MLPPRTAGFTVVELVVAIAVVGILASIIAVSYGQWQKSSANSTVQSDLQHATSGLEAYQNFKDSYPPNLAGTNFSSSQGVALTLYTNAPSVGVYENLSADENAQLFLNACNANIFSTPNNTACQAQGSGGGAKIHIKGTEGANTIWKSPIQQSDIILSCGAACTAITQEIIQQFKDQGGAFPIVVTKNSTPLPEPTLIPNGRASKYCLEGRSANYTDIAYHTVSKVPNTVSPGRCPADSDLQYYP